MSDLSVFLLCVVVPLTLLEVIALLVTHAAIVKEGAKLIRWHDYLALLIVSATQILFVLSLTGNIG